MTHVTTTSHAADPPPRPQHVTNSTRDGIGSARAAKAVARRFLDAVFTGDGDGAVDDLLTVDSVLHLPSGHFIGHPGVRGLRAAMRSAFPDGHVTVEELIAERDRVAIRWTLCGTHRDEFMAVPPTGQPTTVRNVGLFRFVEGKIAEVWVGEC